MTSLTDLQNRFLGAVFDTNVSDTLDFIHPNAKVSAAEQFRIYQHNIFSQLTKALKNIYPVCLQLVGEDFFDALAQTYIHENPSVFVDLNDYGKNFPECIFHFEAAQSLPYLADTASLEWAWHSVYNAADASDFSFEKFADAAELKPDKIIFQLSPGSTLLKSHFPIHEIWEANYKNAEADTIVLNEAQNFFYFIFRCGYERQIVELSEQEWQFLSAIQKNMTFEDLCELPQAKTIIIKIIQHNWLSGFTLLS
jgi:hypothetical protein